jgi:hypothetical protein
VHTPFCARILKLFHNVQLHYVEQVVQFIGRTGTVSFCSADGHRFKPWVIDCDTLSSIFYSFYPLLHHGVLSRMRIATAVPVSLY